MGRGRRSRRRRRRRPPEADLISELPDDLLGSILALLPGKEAARTAVLSTRWRHVWYSSSLNLNLAHLLDRRPSAPPLASALSHLLSRHTAPLGRLRIRVLDLPKSEWPKLQSLCMAFENKPIQHLLFIAFFKFEDAILPQALITGGSLLTLAMEYCQFKDPAALLPHLMYLRVLKLCDCGSFGEDIVDVISCLQMLVGLELTELHASCDFRLRSKSLQLLGLNSLSGGRILSIDAPNLQELYLRSMSCETLEDLEAIVSSLPRLHYFKIQSLRSIPPSLCIRSMSLKTLFLETIRSEDVFVFITDTPNLGLLSIEEMKITKKDFDKMLSSLPMLRTLELIHLYHSSLFEEKFCLTSESLQYLEIHTFLPLKDFSIIDSPSLQTVLIDPRTFNLSNVEVVNAPRISLGYSSPVHIYSAPGRYDWETVSNRIQRMGEIVEL